LDIQRTTGTTNLQLAELHVDEFLIEDSGGSEVGSRIADKGSLKKSNRTKLSATRVQSVCLFFHTIPEASMRIRQQLTAALQMVLISFRAARTGRALMEVPRS